MAEAKFTPGPWKAEGIEEGWPIVTAATTDGLRLTVADIDGLSSQECDANARLIAKAPAMLERLVAILEAYDANDSRGIGEEIEASRKVIAEALGE